MSKEKTIAIIGKSSVKVDHDAFVFSKRLAYEIVALGHSIRHGGYNGGIMQAVSDGASEAIADYRLPHDRNIGVPEVRFDISEERTLSKMFLDPAKDICDRLRGVVLESDVIVVAPVGGDGTMLELQLAIHENSLAEYTGGIIRPIILFELSDGTPWTKIVNEQLKSLENGVDNMETIHWIQVAHTVQDVIKLI